MTETIEVSKVLDSSGITARLDEWTKDAEIIRSRQAELHSEILSIQEEIAALKFQEAALVGAVRACTVLLGDLESDKTTNINLVQISKPHE